MAKEVIPSLRAKKAFKEVTENRRSVSAAMRIAGYSKHTAVKPSNLTKTKSWEYLMKTYLPDDLLAARHRKLLVARRLEQQVFPNSVDEKELYKMFNELGCPIKKLVIGDTVTTVWYYVDNEKTQKEALDLAYKLKGKYAPDKQDITSGGQPINIQISEAIAKKNGLNTKP